MCIDFIQKECKNNGVNIDTIIPLPDLIDPVIVPVTATEVAPSLWPNLNPPQLLAGNAIIPNENGENCFYVDGPGGSGKTFLYKALIQQFNLMDKKVLCVAWTGIAASLLPGGMTCHSAFQLPLNLDSVTFPKLTKEKRKKLTEIDFVIWDEAPMANGVSLEIVDKVFKDLTKDERPFGGKVMILGGDFRQVLPVLPGASRGALIKSSIKHCSLWGKFKIFKLDLNMRASGDEQFSNWLLDIGNGAKCDTENSKTQYSVEVPSICRSNDVIQDVFGSSISGTSYDEFSKFAILSPTNENVNIINEKILSKLSSEAITFNSIDCVKNEDSIDDPNAQLNNPVEF